MRLTTLNELFLLLRKENHVARIANVTPSHSHQRISSMCVDSRELRQGDVFFALSGNRVDGHTFLREAVKKGAIAAVVDAGYRGDTFSIPCIYANDVCALLQVLAQRVLERRRSRIVGITGSVGKTTTKDFIATLLQEKYCITSSPGNRNSQIGLPLTILNETTGEEDVLVLEMSMDAAGQIRRLVEIAPPDVAVITCVDIVHAHNFDCKEGIAAAKGEIFSHPKTSLGILRRDCQHFSVLNEIGDCAKLSFSMTDSDAAIYLEEKGGKIAARESSGPWETLGTLPVFGGHNRQNFLAALAVARHFGLSWSCIRNAMPRLKLPEKRCTFVEKEGIIFINDAYNASLPSVTAVLQDFPRPKTPGGKKIAVLGEMRELGKFSRLCHQKVGECALEYVDEMWCLGEQCEPIVACWKQAKRPVTWCRERVELVSLLRGAIHPGDVVLIKGSRALEMDAVITELFS